MLSSVFKTFMFSALMYSHLGQLFTVLAVLLALLFGVFLFWRAGRRELVESQVLFDVVAMFVIGGLIFGRVVDFLVRWDFYEWSIRRFIFFNIFWGFDILGAALGGICFVWLYLRQKRGNFWEFFDMASSAISFSVFVYLFIKSWQLGPGVGRGFYLALLYSFSYLVLFWLIKRLEKQKKHRGFFVCLFLFFSSAINVAFLILREGLNISHNWWTLGFSSVVLVVSALSWYLLSKRRMTRDLKSFFGFILLSTFKLKRVITNIREANSSARVIILSPFFLVKGLYYLVKYVGREIYLSFMDLVHAFGVGK